MSHVSLVFVCFRVEVQVTLWTFSGCNGPPRPPVSPSTKEEVAGGGLADSSPIPWRCFTFG